MQESNVSGRDSDHSNQFLTLKHTIQGQQYEVFLL